MVLKNNQSIIQFPKKVFFGWYSHEPLLGVGSSLISFCVRGICVTSVPGGQLPGHSHSSFTQQKVYKKFLAILPSVRATHL
jgi:hypothetical protein